MTSTKATKKGFTIIELLTVLSIIIILISVLVPGMNRARVFAKKVTQKGQFHEISKGLELFRNDHQETYPDSGAADTAATPVGYCGAMKLCEAMLGQDGMGFHPSSKFLADATTSGTDPLSTTDIYPFDLCVKIDPAAYTDPLRTNLRERAKYLESDNIKASKLQDMYTWNLSTSSASAYNYPAAPVSFEDNSTIYHNAVITDVYLHAVSRCGGVKLGMPVLYYKADPSKLVHDPCFFSTALYPTTNPSIYNFDDNHGLTRLGCPWESSPAVEHPMFTSPLVFYKAITNKKVTSTPRPHNEDGYILISAGYDGLYGTRDDVFNFAD